MHTKRSICMGIQKIHRASIVNQAECNRVHQKLIDHLEKGEGICIVAEDVERIGAAGVQVLVSAAKTFQQKELSYTIELPSAELIHTFKQLGCMEIVKDFKLI